VNQRQSSLSGELASQVYEPEPPEKMTCGDSVSLNAELCSVLQMQ